MDFITDSVCMKVLGEACITPRISSGELNVRGG